MMMQNVSQVCRPLKSFFLKIDNGGRPIRLRDPLYIIVRYCNCLNLKMAAVRHLEISKLKFLTASHFGDTFCIVALNFVEIGQTVADISHFFRIFQVKCKYSLDDCAQVT